MRFSFRQQNTDFTEGPLFGRIVLYCIPLMLSGMLQLLYNAADIVVVGRFGSTQSLAAVGSTASIISLLVNLFLGLSVGVSVMVAQQIGARKDKDVSETVHTAVAVSLITGTVVGIFGLIMTRQFLIWMDSPEDVIDLATVYMKIYFLGMPANMLYNFGSSVLRATGDTKRPLIFLTISGAVNVLLNLLLVIVFRLDTAGVAIATVISQILSAALVVLALMHAHDACHLDLRKIRVHKAKMIEMIRLGLPAGLQSSLFSISNIMIQSSINSFGSLAMAANTAGSNLDGFIYIAMNSVYHAAITFTGQNVGAKKYDRIGKITGACTVIVVLIGAVLGAIVLAFRTPLLQIYTDEAAVIEMATMRLAIMASTYFICGIMEVICAQLRAMGRSLVPMLVSVLGACGLRMVWIYTVFVWVHTLPVLYLSYPVSWAATAAAHFVCYVIVKRGLVRRCQAENMTCQHS